MTKPKILLVEDEMVIALVVEEVIAEAGYDVVHCLAGTEAIAALDSHAREFRTLVTDIQLPGAKGWDVARRARELHPKIGVVYVSGDSGQGWHEGSGLPGSLFLQKPYSNGDLVLAISKASWD